MAHLDDRGSAAIFFVVAIGAMLAMIGLAVDYSGVIRSRQHAYLVAGEAARSGAQQVAAPSAMSGLAPSADPAAAAAAADTYLSAAGVTGTATITNGGTLIVVTTAESYTPRFLGAFGVGPITVEGSAEARLAHVQQGNDL